MINANNLTGMENFDYIRVNYAGSFVKVWNETSQAVYKKLAFPHNTSCWVSYNVTMAREKGE